MTRWEFIEIQWTLINLATLVVGGLTTLISKSPYRRAGIAALGAFAVTNEICIVSGVFRVYHGLLGTTLVILGILAVAMIAFAVTARLTKK